MKSDRQLISIVIAHKQNGETFRDSTLVPVIEHGGLPIYHDDVQRFDITGFETRSHLVYLISDVPATGQSPADDRAGAGDRKLFGEARKLKHALFRKMCCG